MAARKSSSGTAAARRFVHSILIASISTIVARPRAVNSRSGARLSAGFERRLTCPEAISLFTAS